MSSDIVPDRHSRRAVADVNRIPSLVSLAVDALVRNPDVLTKPGVLRSLGEHCAGILLASLIRQGRLTYDLARAFQESEHASIVTAISGLDLFAALSAHPNKFDACRATR